jgi:hypothetical protein
MNYFCHKQLAIMKRDKNEKPLGAQSHDSYITMCHYDHNLQYVKDSRFVF